MTIDPIEYAIAKKRWDRGEATLDDEVILMTAAYQLAHPEPPDL